MKKLKLDLRILLWEIQRDIQKATRFIWNRGIKLFWYKLWIRKDEFHSSLDMDIHATMDMDSDQRDKYYKDLVKRRNIAHEKGLS